MSTSDGRRAHYRRFYDCDPPPGDELVLVFGNCQAESVRLLLDPTGMRSLRVPPAFELVDAELVLLRRLLARATALVTQPVRAGYRGLALGTEELAAWLRPDARLLTFPVVRYAGLHPFHVVVHSARPSGGTPVPLAQPPLVPYHDLRTVATVLGHPLSTVEPDGVSAVARASVDELRRRERLTDVTVSPALERPGPAHMRTVNHPGNPVLCALTGAIAAELGVDPPRDPGRQLLSSVVAPVEPVVARHWGFTDDSPADTSTDSWRVDGREVSDASIAQRHRQWYATHPEVARAVWDRHQRTAALLGLVPEDRHRPAGGPRGRRPAPGESGRENGTPNGIRTRATAVKEPPRGW